MTNPTVPLGFRLGGSRHGDTDFLYWSIHPYRWAVDPTCCICCSYDVAHWLLMHVAHGLLNMQKRCPSSQAETKSQGWSCACGSWAPHACLPTSRRHIAGGLMKTPYPHKLWSSLVSSKRHLNTYSGWMIMSLIMWLLSNVFQNTPACILAQPEIAQYDDCPGLFGSSDQLNCP